MVTDRRVPSSREIVLAPRRSWQLMTVVEQEGLGALRGPVIERGRRRNERRSAMGKSGNHTT